MKICLAQIASVKGDIAANIANHKKLINQAVKESADLVIFPELSLTGYEPDLAIDLAIHLNDNRLDCFQEISNTENIIIGVGAPLKAEQGIYISLILFQPQQARNSYSKQYLHEDEEPFFVCGPQASGVLNTEPPIALAICYEISIPAHAEGASQHGASIYISSVAKTPSGVKKAHQRVSEIASEHGMTVFMSNCVGPCDGDIGGGQSGIWNEHGELVDVLGDQDEGFLIYPN
mgnify:CR=1 FL=1